MRSPNKLCPSVYPDKPYFHLLLNPISLQLQHFCFLIFHRHVSLFYPFFFCKMTLIYPKAQLLKFRNGNYQGMKPVSFLLSRQVLSQLPCHHLSSVHGKRSIDARLCLWNQMTFKYRVWHFG